MGHSLEYESREAARFVGMRYLREFKRLPREEQAAIVAHYRTHSRVEGTLQRLQEAKV